MSRIKEKPGKTVAESDNDIERRNRISERKKHRRAFLLTVTALFLALYLVFTAAVFCGCYYSFRSSSKSTETYSVRCLNERKRTLCSADAASSNFSYGLYISLTHIDKLCDLSVAGDSSKLTVMFRDSGESAVCFADSSFVYINGNPVRLSAPVICRGGEYYFPMEFIEDYFLGVKVEYISGVCRLSLADGADTELSLKLKPGDTTQKLETEN